MRCESPIRWSYEQLRAALNTNGLFCSHTLGCRKTRNARPSTSEQLDDRRSQQNTFHKPDVLNVEQYKMMRIMSQLLPAEARVRMGLGTDDPLIEFHIEYPKYSGWPAGVDAVQAARFLERSFEMAAQLPHTMLKFFETQESPFAIEDVVKRLNGSHKINWYLRTDQDLHTTPARWEIFDRELEVPDLQCCYGGGAITHSFSNQAYRKEVLTTGKVHVAVGFVDLGVLLTAKLVDTAATDGPLRFVGYDIAAYAVAKTLVIWEIAHGGSASDAARAMIQVWFSTSWSKPTLKIFTAAATRCAARSHDSTDVCTLFEHWSTSPGVKLRTARKKWFAHKDGRAARSSISHLLQRADRSAQIAYELTGDFGVVDGQALVGSVVMFDCPGTTAPLDDDESVLTTAPLNSVLELAEEKDCTIIKALEHLHLANCQKMASWATQKKVVVELHHKAVEDAVTEIAGLRPWSMSWSNVLDYIGAREFHHIARSCSVHGDTLHFGYSMNWSCDVRGAHPVDYNSAENKSTRTTILQLGQEAIHACCSKAMPDFSRRFRHPPPENPLNPAAYVLGISQHRKWVDHFIGIAQSTGPCALGNAEPVLWNPLTDTGSNTIHLTWTYDADITFNATT